MHKELPVRIAHRIQGFRSLPFIVGCNPTILDLVSESKYLITQGSPVSVPNRPFFPSAMLQLILQVDRGEGMELEELIELFVMRLKATVVLFLQHELYIRAFHILSGFPPIHNNEEEAAYSRLLRNLLDDHKHVVTQLAAGFKECRKHIQVNMR